MLWGGGNDCVQLSEGGVEFLLFLLVIVQLIEQVVNGLVVCLVWFEVECCCVLVWIEISKCIFDVSLILGNKCDEFSVCNMWVVGFFVFILVFDSNQGNELEVLKCVDIVCDVLVVVELQMQGEVVQGFECLCNVREEVMVLCNDIVLVV